MQKILGIMLLVIGCVFFMVGLHGIDNSWNLHVLNQATGQQWIDSSLTTDFTVEKLYALGVLETIVGFVIAILGTAVILFDPEKKKKNLAEEYDHL